MRRSVRTQRVHARTACGNCVREQHARAACANSYTAAMAFFRKRAPASALAAFREIAGVPLRERDALVARAVTELAALPAGRKRANAKDAGMPGILRERPLHMDG